MYRKVDPRRTTLVQKKICKKELNTNPIKSAIAKYDKSGNISCVLCGTVLKSSNVWKVHVNSKQHKQNVVIATNMKNELRLKPKISEPAKIETKCKDIKEISLKNERSAAITTSERTETDSKSQLPEKFFDDPSKDAMSRNVDYKNLQDDEWAKFQREIREVTTISNAIVIEERNEASIARQIDEINDQMLRWSKFIQIERKKESFRKPEEKQKNKEYTETQNFNEDSNESIDFDEFSDWRLKTYTAKKPV
ncbi:zinc finger protein 830 [Teleopsis dalmanni]|uniref:zinc finger protein 830 n=1 Tax=Teleopsis dalmanni TaxID=139649 RepID=UPI0018CDECE5|nr:zinc finger protein 830 [Teleopsis dalmanni]